jgi:hypothetical protein
MTDFKAVLGSSCAPGNLYTPGRGSGFVRHSVRVVLVGVALLFGALASDLVGVNYQALGVLVLSMALAIAGAVIAMRGMMDLLGELV